MVVRNLLVLEGNVDMNKMYSVCFLLLIFIFCGALFAFDKGTSKNDDTFYNQISAFQELVERNKMTVTDWHVRIKSKTERVDDFSLEVESFETAFSEFERTAVEENGNYIHVTFTNGSYEEELHENIKMLATKTSNGYEIEKTYELISSDGSVVKDQQWLEDRMNKLGIDLQSSMPFYELTAEMDDSSQDLVIEAERFMSELGATKLEALDEKTFVSLSAYHEEWMNGIATSGDKEMNVQIALRENQELGSRTTVTFGTPIITTEY